MWNIWRRRAKMVQSYPIGSMVHLTQFGGEFPVVNHRIYRDRVAYVILDVRGFEYAKQIKV